MKVRVKICGVKTASDLEACAEAGVDLVGFNFYEKSKRYITPATAAELVRHLPLSITGVGVFVQAPPEVVGSTCGQAGLRHAQLHGDEKVADYLRAGPSLIEVLRVRDRSSLARGPSPGVAWVLLDAWVEGFGGEGRALDWSWIAEATASWEVPVVLAGGLTPDNVGQAIAAVRPWGVDVASGVESAPGKKDPSRIEAFAQAVAAAAAAL